MFFPQKAVIYLTEKLKERKNEFLFFGQGFNQRRQNGNVFALDMSGNLLWRIEDIVELFPDPFRGVWIIADKDREETERLYMVTLIDGHDYCVCSNFWGQNHLIDMTEKKLVVLRGFK